MQSYHPQVHCWESGEHHGHPGHMCVLLNGHADDHQWIRNDHVIDHLNHPTGDHDGR